MNYVEADFPTLQIQDSAILPAFTEENKRARTAQHEASTSSASEVFSHVPPHAGNDDTAKEMLPKKDYAATFGQATSALVGIAGLADAIAAMEEACEQGVQEACDWLSHEEAAKAAWLAQMDAPWRAGVTATVSEVALQALEVAREDRAKKAWLERLDAPAWSADVAAAAATALVAIARKKADAAESLAKLDAAAAWLADAPAAATRKQEANVDPATDAVSGLSQYDPWLDDFTTTGTSKGMGKRTRE